MTFVAAPSQPAPPVADAVAGDGWWPDLSIARFRDAIRLGTLVTDGRARDALVNAMVSAHVELADWRAARVAEGAANLQAIDALDGIPVLTLGGVKYPVILWTRIVYSYAAADLAETQNDITATDQGRTDREQRATSAEDHRRNATIAVRDLLKKRRSRVGLL